MKQGWFQENYWIFFSQEEIVKWTEVYELGKYLPGYGIYGLRGWDDFILLDDAGFYTVPTVPLVRKYFNKIDFNSTMELEIDNRYFGKIKWYKKPLIVGGSATNMNNIEFVDMDQHSKLVKWWNQQLSQTMNLYK